MERMAPSIKPKTKHAKFNESMKLSGELADILSICSPRVYGQRTQLLKGIIDSWRKNDEVLLIHGTDSAAIEKENNDKLEGEVFVEPEETSDKSVEKDQVQNEEKSHLQESDDISDNLSEDEREEVKGSDAETDSEAGDSDEHFSGVQDGISETAGDDVGAHQEYEIQPDKLENYIPVIAFEKDDNDDSLGFGAGLDQEEINGTTTTTKKGEEIDERIAFDTHTDKSDSHQPLLKQEPNDESFNISDDEILCVFDGNVSADGQQNKNQIPSGSVLPAPVQSKGRPKQNRRQLHTAIGTLRKTAVKVTQKPKLIASEQAQVNPSVVKLPLALKIVGRPNGLDKSTIPKLRKRTSTKKDHLRAFNGEESDSDVDGNVKSSAPKDRPDKPKNYYIPHCYCMMIAKKLVIC
ncbi:uncharacterized protein LOC127749558 [Frankliniella occidentalis]|uniref:Uncharacterized protein LOC127749558 n=1 Tax=Frankliniella occidentalis TaxID=133901 RepID=A0A9C6WWG8_FRAOC|nr:uncharacterized protein LOC127749558 [Frankliniella occidentalis]